MTPEAFCLVGLSRQKLNRGAAVHLRRFAQAAERGETLPAPPTRPTVYTAPKRHLRDRLTDDQVQRLVATYQSGALRRDLAEQFEISLSSVARVLRQHEALRRRHKGMPTEHVDQRKSSLQ
jgi:hypothetical protein